ncbi:uncharacterized protein LOC108666326 [Hyalella azteca]|uniref:Uncharacterized protein LOC108666326 n=1 Tax=Hyalella azteca TaxID=294128 RepID=A0A8B7N4X9_HYAAZ|nr:uncharacterized protein LOC108666326 [Hyalella azteca]
MIKMPETCQRMELHNTDTVLVLCKQLSSYHAESSTEEMENSCIQTLHQIASKLSSHKPSNDVILAVGGRSSHLLQCLSSAAAKLRWRVVVAAVQCIQALVDHLVVDQTAKVPGSVAAQAMADIMQLLTLQLQTRYPIPNVCHSEALYGLLRVAKLILQSCLRDSILPHSFITVCRPYMFYGLPAYRSAFVDAGAHLDAMDRLQDEAELLMSSDYDPESSVKNHFTNRNRRKRLRRKKTNPGRNQPAHGPHAPLSSTSEGSCASRSRFSSFSAASRAMPVQLRPPQPAEMTAALGFRCAQAPSGAESMEKTVTSKSEENPREEVLLQDPEVDAHEYMALDTQRNLSNGQRGDCGHDAPAEVVTGGHDAPAEVVTSSRGTPAEVVTSGSEWEELTEDEEGVWSASHHTARVRQAALAALSSLVTVSVSSDVVVTKETKDPSYDVTDVVVTKDTKDTSYDVTDVVVTKDTKDTSYDVTDVVLTKDFEDPSYDIADFVFNKDT